MADKTMIYGTDYHIHTTYSDGREGPEACIEAAVKKGLREIGFSDHLSLNHFTKSWSMNYHRLIEYTDHILRLKEQHHEIEIRLGIEVDYFPNQEELISKVINDYPFDFIIGSVHYIGEETIEMGPGFFMGKDIKSVFENYFNLVCDAASTGFYDIIGHPDYITLQNIRPDDDITHLYSMMASAFEIHDVAFELNTNGRNRPLQDFYPDRKYLSLFAEHGVPVCVNSDAHFPERIGQYFDEAYDLLRSAGYKEMAVFARRERYMIPGL